MKTKYLIPTIGLLFIQLFLSCSKMNDLHEPYLLQGERIYVGQPDSVRIYPGLERVVINYWISDPKAKKMKVFWNNKQDSIKVDIPVLSVKEPGTISINNLEANDYSFEFITFNNNWKNPSIPMEVLAEVYSKNYLSRVFPRQIEYAHYITQDSIYVKLRKPTEKSAQSLISYMDKSGNKVEMIVQNNMEFVVLNNFDSKLAISTSFLPIENALDTLYSSPKEHSIIDRKMNKSLFKRWNPVGIPYKQYSNDWSIEKMWDNNYLGTSYLQGSITFPHDFTFDLGELKKINRIKQWQRWTESILYADQQIKRFEIWGSPTNNVTNSMDGWTLLGSFTSIKPSGKPVGQLDPIDKEFVRNGEDFVITGEPPETRYIRYRVLESWKNTGAVAIGEIEFFFVD